VRLVNQRANLRVALLGLGKGASAFIAALNAVLPNPFGDSVEQHTKDTLEAGCFLGDPMLVSTMCKEVAGGIGSDFLRVWESNLRHPTVSH
jgi:aspartate oxidase